MIEICAEKPHNVAPVRRLHLQAFHPSPHEARLVDLLRSRRRAPISLVALEQEQLVGHILFSPITLEPAQRALHGLGLAPLAVLPELQHQGIGSKLVVHGLEACQKGRYDLVVVLGDPGYYARFGFVRAKQRGLGNEYGADEAFMALELRPGALDGVHGLIKYPPEFKKSGC